MLFKRIPANQLTRMLLDAGAKELHLSRILHSFVNVLKYPPSLLMCLGDGQQAYAPGAQGVESWLNQIKYGYGGKFSSTFGTAGYEDVSDLVVCCPDAKTLYAILKGGGAQPPQQRQIEAALTKLVGGPLSEKASNTSTDAAGAFSVPASHDASPAVEAEAVLTLAAECAAPVARAGGEGDVRCLAPRKHGDSLRSSGAALEAHEERDDEEEEVDVAPPASSLPSAPPGGKSTTTSSSNSSISMKRRSTSNSSVGSVGSNHRRGTGRRQLSRPANTFFQGNRHLMLSYQWDHQQQVVEIRKLLEGDHAIKCWMDVDNMKEDIYDSMAEGVQGALAVVSCMSPAYQDSANCKLELKFAQQSGTHANFVPPLSHIHFVFG